MKIVTIIGTRPEIVKMAPLIELFSKECKHTLIHSGQHYSPEMDEVFFHDLELPLPDVNLQVGSLGPVPQVAAIMEGVAEQLERLRPDAVLVHGDTNTTLAAALATAKLNDGSALVHIEAGARSGVRKQVEEVNRKLVDQISDLLFAATPEDRNHLLEEGIEETRIFVTGNTVIESSYRMASLIGTEHLKNRFGLEEGGYAVATFHRQETVDHRAALSEIVDLIHRIGRDRTVVIPLHPRTKKRLEEFDLRLQGTHINLISPIGYRDMIALVKGARVCLTDSGGLQEEAAILGTPAVILREKTEHTRYVNSGFHCLYPAIANNPMEYIEGIWTNPPDPLHVPREYPRIGAGILSKMRKVMNDGA